MVVMTRKRDEASQSATTVPREPYVNSLWAQQALKGATANLSKLQQQSLAKSGLLTGKAPAATPAQTEKLAQAALTAKSKERADAIAAAEAALASYNTSMAAAGRNARIPCHTTLDTAEAEIAHCRQAAARCAEALSMRLQTQTLVEWLAQTHTHTWLINELRAAQATALRRIEEIKAEAARERQRLQRIAAREAEAQRKTEAKLVRQRLEAKKRREARFRCSAQYGAAVDYLRRVDAMSTKVKSATVASSAARITIIASSADAKKRSSEAAGAAEYKVRYNGHLHWWTRAKMVEVAGAAMASRLIEEWESH